MPITHWIYPTNQQSSYYLAGPNGNTEVSPEHLLAGIEQRPDDVDTWLLSTGFRQMRPGDAVWIYASNPYQNLCALAQALAVYPDGDRWYVSLAWRIEATRKLMRHPIRREAFGQIAQRAAIRADATTTAVLDGWLTDNRISVFDLDDELDQGSIEDARIRTLRSIVLRQGQAAFRGRLFAAYDGRCAITGECVEEVLEAAHIQPYLGQHTNAVTNGLLLRADVHTLFDLHLIAIDEDDRVLVSPRLDGSPYAKLRGAQMRLPRRADQRPSRRRLATHRKLLK